MKSLQELYDEVKGDDALKKSFAHSDASGQVSASLFNGICGIGYEMLRYARPRDVLSVL